MVKFFGIGLIGVDKEKYPDKPILLDPWKFHDMHNVQVVPNRDKNNDQLDYYMSMSTDRTKQIILDLQEAIKLVENE